jgi:uncharacterized membrane protein
MDAQPALNVALLWMVFAALHIGLATRQIRAALVARLGEHGFAVLFSVLASVSFAVAIAYYAAHQYEGAAGFALGAVPAARWALIGVTVLGVLFMGAASTTYAGSPYDLLAHRIRPPRGMERITRHAFFWGLGMFALAHALLATRLVGAVLFAGVALVAIGGAYHQDRKLLARIGRPYAGYVAATSAIPFAAIVAGRQRFPWADLPVAALAVGLVVAVILRTVHESIFAYGGAFVIAGTIGGAALFTWQSVRRAQREAASATTSVLRSEVLPSR